MRLVENPFNLFLWRHVKRKVRAALDYKWPRASPVRAMRFSQNLT
jgi:hypothetical protein